MRCTSLVVCVMWVVYVVSGVGKQFPTKRQYVGSTQVRDAETSEMAAKRREDAHKSGDSRGAAFLRCCKDIKLV